MSHQIIEQAIRLSKADSAIIMASETSTINLRWANNTLTTNGSSRSQNVIVISIVGKSVGVQSGAVSDTQTLEQLIRQSEHNAHEASDAQDFAELIDNQSSSNFEDPAICTSADIFSDFAKKLGPILKKNYPRNQKLFGFAEHNIETVWLGTSAGVRLRHSQPSGLVQWNLKGNKPGTSVWHGESTVDFTDIDPNASEELLFKRLGWCDHQLELPAGRYDTILPPSAVADLLVYMYWSLSGRDAAEGRSAFSKQGGGTRIKEQITKQELSLYSDPYDTEIPTLPWVLAAASSGTSSVFDNGMKLGATDWIKNGVLANFINTRASAKETGQSFAPFINNLILEGNSNTSLDEMIAQTERGLLLTSLWYIREVDPQSLLLTGLTRDGVYLVENGKVAVAVNNFRFNESPISLLGRITEIGKSMRTLPREWSDSFTLARMSALRVPDFNMSSVSPAS